MPWQCRLRENPVEHPDKFKSVQIGDMWFDTYTLSGEAPEWKKGELSAEYMRDWLMVRQPLIIACPSQGGRYRLCYVDQHYSYEGPLGHGWTVTGEPPNLTAAPSINLVGDYHGFLRDGLLSDDVEGRLYGAISADPQSARQHYR